MKKDNFPRINRGKRAIVAGRTGSGKSTLGNWLLLRSPGHWVIINPKWTKAYQRLPESNTVKGFNNRDLEKSFRENRFTIIEPGSLEADHDTMDDFILWLHENYSNVGLCVDELYTLHNNGRAGPGLLGWLTRGRELKQSFLGLTQRPCFISKFLFSESDYIGAMSLIMTDDRKRMVQLTGRRAFEEPLPDHYWRWYDAGADKLKLFRPIPLTG